MASQSIMTVSFRCMLIAAVLSLNLPSMSAFVPSIPRTTSTSSRTTNHEQHLQVHMSVVPQDMPRASRRLGILNRLGFFTQNKEKDTPATAQELNASQPKTTQKPTKTRPRTVITTVEDLQDYFQDKDRKFRDDKTGAMDHDSLLNTLTVEGNTQRIGSPDHLDHVHPVVQLLHERRRNQSLPSPTIRDDGFKIALAIEGGGMRGCVSAGMASALHYLNLTDAIDVVYGSSAGSIVGSYLITRQLPWFGPEVYYDQLTTAGRQFIDTRRLLRSMGLGLLDPRLFKDVLTRPEEGKPVLNLSYLLTRTFQQTKPLDWNKFVQMQQVQPLKVVASALQQEQAIIMDMASGSFETLEELASCMHASCLLPGLAGPMMNLNRTAVAVNATGQKVIVGNNLLVNSKNNNEDLEPLADSLLYEPLPYRAALKEGATHVVTLRSRPDGVDVSGKSSLVEGLIFKRFLLRKNWLPRIYKYLRAHGHKQRYAEDVLRLNHHANSTRDYRDLAEPHLLTVALPPGSVEVTKLETARQEIFEGLRRGFARAYDALVEDPRERGRGAHVAKEAFPDEIMDYNPLDFVEVDSTESAFARYMRANDVVPNAWESSTGQGKLTAAEK